MNRKKNIRTDRRHSEEEAFVPCPVSPYNAKDKDLREKRHNTPLGKKMPADYEPGEVFTARQMTDHRSSRPAQAKLPVLNKMNCRQVSGWPISRLFNIPASARSSRITSPRTVGLNAIQFEEMKSFGRISFLQERSRFHDVRIPSVLSERRSESRRCRANVRQRQAGNDDRAVCITAELAVTTPFEIYVERAAAGVTTMRTI